MDMKTAQEKCNVINHPLLTHKLSKIRDEKAHPHEFRNLIKEISRYLAFEASKKFTLEEYDIKTPMEKTKALKVKDNPIIVPILRAGMGMLDGFLETLPFAQVGHVGIYRDKFIKNTVEYFFRLPNDLEDKPILLLDPLLATGSTAVAAMNRLKEYEVGPIQFITLLASIEGIANVSEFHPDVEIITLSIERELNKDGYLLPGIGDAGDRLYGTL